MLVVVMYTLIRGVGHMFGNGGVGYYLEDTKLSEWCDLLNNTFFCRLVWMVGGIDIWIQIKDTLLTMFIIC